MRKINPILRLQAWMDSVPGQTFLNYAYSWGAAIVILAALFKLTHLPGGNLMLFVGMGMEVFVFFLAAFDRPFDKTEIGKELPKALPEDEDILRDDSLWNDGGEVTLPTSSVAVPKGASVLSTPSATDLPIQPSLESEHLAALIRTANDELLQRAQAVLSPDMEAATQAYIEKMQTLNATLALVEEQSRQMTRDNTEMENLNRALTGISVIYEHQLKSVSAQVGTIDRINEQTRRMAEQIEELNHVYARMIQALTVNMREVTPQPNAPQ
ncbi:MAG: gliding motility protein GldL [Bacteroidales bacterium]|nr:gliding motility protein GldL [Bacteroidales bacterium]